MDKALKQRLVGASVLIILAVIVLPMLLSGRSETLKQESRQIELPAKPDELSIETRRFPVGAGNDDSPVADRGTQSRPQPAETGLAEDRSRNDVVPLPESTEDQSSSAAAEESGVEAGQPGSGDTHAATATKPQVIQSITLSSERKDNVDVSQGLAEPEDAPRYLVQVASFSSKENANALADKLRARNLSVLMDVVDRTAGRLHRVRVGPYAQRSDADSVVSDLRSEMKDLTPRVLDLRPGDTAPVSTPSDPLVRWVVQVGSFNKADSAESLVARLRLAGLPAFSESVSSSAGTAYKVRIGPEINRDNARELAEKVRAEHGLDAFVTTQQ